MAYSRQTEHYGLPLPTGSDKSSWLDTNEAFSAIDSAIWEATQASGSEEQAITDLQNSVAELNASVTTNTAAINTERSERTSADALLRTDMTSADSQLSSRIATLEGWQGSYPSTVDALFRTAIDAFYPRSWRTSIYPSETGREYPTIDTSYYNNYQIGLTDIDAGNTRASHETLIYNACFGLDAGSLTTMFNALQPSAGTLCIVPYQVLAGKLFRDSDGAQPSYTGHSAFVVATSDFTSDTYAKAFRSLGDCTLVYMYGNSVTTNYELRHCAVYQTYNSNRDETVFWLDLPYNFVNHGRSIAGFKAVFSKFITVGRGVTYDEFE